MARSANDRIEQKSIVRMTLLERVRVAMVRGSLAFFGEALFPELRHIVERLTEQLEDVPFNRRRTRAFQSSLLAIRQHTYDVFRQWLGELKIDLEEVAENELAFLYGIAAAEIGRFLNIRRPGMTGVSEEIRRGRYGDSTDFITLGQHIENSRDAFVAAIAASLDFGFTRDLTPRQILRNIAGTRRQPDGVFGALRRRIREIVTTAVTQAVTIATTAFSRRNSALIATEKYVAILDSRTSVMCASLHGTIYKVGEGPYPPIHRHCRSRRVFQLRSARAMGITQDQAGATVYRQLDGQPGETQTLVQFLDSQPVEVQNEILGTTRARWWREGRLDRNLNPRQILNAEYRPLRISELSENLR